MFVNKLSLTNFRSFKNTQTIDFAPVTLLFGPNSVGKSSVVMALFYLQQLLETGNANPQRITALGNKYVGGFKNLVNGKDLSKPIIIRIDIDKPSITTGSTYDSTLFFIDSAIEQALKDEGEKPDLLRISSPSEWANKISIEFEIKWSESKNTAFVARQAVWFDDIFIGEAINQECTTNALVHKVNYTHPLLNTDLEDEWALNQADKTEYCVGEFHDIVLKSATSIPRIVEFEGVKNAIKPQYHADFEYKSQSGVLAKTNQVLTTSIESENGLNTRRIEEVFSDIFVAPLDNVLHVLSESLAIGPIRQIPDSTFDAEEIVYQKDWYAGRASWDVVFNAPHNHLEKINRWLANPIKLDLGYALVEKSEKGGIEYVSEPSLFSDGALSKISSFKGDLSSEKYVSQAPFQRDNITLWDLHNDIEVTAAEVGAGVSQVFPLVVAATSDIKGVICCEQPELHIHPKAQVAIGDLLTQSGSNNRFLIETHSEHLVLRLLRRIRETEAGTLPNNLQNVQPHDISILYLKPTEEGVCVERTQITPDGDFENDWPSGFFEERDLELF